MNARSIYLISQNEYNVYIFEKYNFFNVYANYGLLYIYLDRYLLSIFLSNFSNI